MSGMTVAAPYCSSKRILRHWHYHKFRQISEDLKKSYYQDFVSTTDFLVLLVVSIFLNRIIIICINNYT
jgi:hypothetical protein